MTSLSEEKMSSKKSMLIFLTLMILASFMTMAVIPPPPGACTPGFWKQEQHFQYWIGFTPGDNYPGTSMTLLDALQGGHDTRVSRFVVAGWLNAANPFAPCDENLQP
jgi:hypothetical protein